MVDENNNADAPETPEDDDAPIVTETAEEADAPAENPAAQADDGPDLAAQVADLNDKLLRALADAENTRRRAERQVEDASKYAIANFAREMVGVADNLSRALASVTPEARAGDEAFENLCSGIQMTEQELLNAFERVGIKAIETEGKRLDPNLHEAMFEIEDPSQPAGTIMQVIRSGFVIGERLLRSAQVGVSKGGPKNVPEGPAEADGYDAKGGAVGENKGENLNEEL